MLLIAYCCQRRRKWYKSLSAKSFIGEYGGAVYKEQTIRTVLQNNIACSMVLTILA